MLDALVNRNEKKRKVNRKIFNEGKKWNNPFDYSNKMN